MTNPAIVGVPREGRARNSRHGAGIVRGAPGFPA